jgi:UDP-N-acetyl-D-galactosamine dehydrogenase
MSERVAIIGLGYVGLPVALAFARTHDQVVGFDINPTRVAELRDCRDRTGEVDAETLRQSRLIVTDDPEALTGTTFFVVTVPTPIDANKQPDLTPIRKASETVGRALQPGAVVVYESTVYPGVTEEFCGPILERVSGLRCGVDFTLGYSPERINPGDREHTLERITKVVSAQDPTTLERVANAYGSFVAAGIHRAPSIKVAESAKVIENTQRDLNIALMNELAIILDRLGLRTADVLEAAGTKWNFLRFSPGLVGGHCIGVDPYYLTARAEQVGYFPQVILAGRRINDGMGTFVAQRLVKLLIDQDLTVKGARVGVLGLTFKENVPDLRNSRVPDILNELAQFGIAPIVHDAVASPDEALHEFGLNLAPWSAFEQLDALVVAVAHDEYRQAGTAALCARVRPGGIVLDVKSCLQPASVPADRRYWSL